MEWFERLNDALHYIEEHLDDSFDITQAAKNRVLLVLSFPAGLYVCCGHPAVGICSPQTHEQGRRRITKRCKGIGHSAEVRLRITHGVQPCVSKHSRGNAVAGEEKRRRAHVIPANQLPNYN